MNTISQLISSTIPPDRADRMYKAETQDVSPPSPSLLPFAMITGPMILRMQRQVWIPNTPIEVRISQYVHCPRGNILYPNIYVIELSHGKYHWTIRKRYKDFQTLHTILKLHSAKEHLLFRAAGLNVPHLPSFVDAYLIPKQMTKIMRQLEYYLEHVLASRILRNHEDTLMFCQVSYLSFKPEYGNKGLENVVDKRSGGYYGLKALNWFKKIFLRWRKRWVIMKDSYFAYSDINVVLDVSPLEKSAPQTTCSKWFCPSTNNWCTKAKDATKFRTAFRNRNVSCVMLVDSYFSAHIQTKPPLGQKILSVLESPARFVETRILRKPAQLNPLAENALAGISGGDKDIDDIQNNNDSNNKQPIICNSNAIYNHKTNNIQNMTNQHPRLHPTETAISSNSLFERKRFKKNRLVLQNRSRKVLIKFNEEREAREWLEYINCQLQQSPLAQTLLLKHRFESFAPQRTDAHAFWFVDGASYFSAVADALYSAKEEIFIADWWLSPQYYLKRPLGKDAEKWRLDKILQKKAEDGVKIYIMIYKEVALALGINSFYTKQVLKTLHPYNICIIRHPDHLKSQVYMWAHHEKIVCIDQRIAFLGGLDICYARWDDYQHRLTDLGDEEPVNALDYEKNYLMRARQGLLNPKTIIQERKIIPPLNTGEKIRNKFRHVPSTAGDLSHASNRRKTNIVGQIKRAGGGGVAPTTLIFGPTSGDRKRARETADDDGAGSEKSLSLQTRERPEIEASSTRPLNYSERDPDPKTADTDGSEKSQTQVRPEIDSSSATPLHYSEQELNPKTADIIIANTKTADDGGSVRNLDVKTQTRENLHESVQNKNDYNTSDDKGKKLLIAEWNSGGKNGISKVYSSLKQHIPIPSNVIHPSKIFMTEHGKNGDKKSFNSLNDVGLLTDNLSNTKERKTSSYLWNQLLHSLATTSKKGNISAPVSESGDFVPPSAPYGNSEKKAKKQLMPLYDEAYMITGFASEKDKKMAEKRRLNYEVRQARREAHQTQKFEREQSSNSKTKKELSMPSASPWKQTLEKLFPRLDDDDDKLKKHQLTASDTCLHQLGPDVAQEHENTCLRDKYGVPKGKTADDSGDDYYATTDLTHNIDLIGSGKYWIGKDYSNFIYKDFAHVDLPYIDLIDRHSIPRMPWHDVGCVLYGLPANDIGRHFIERWNYAVIEKYKEDPYMDLLLPKVFKELNIPQELADSSLKCDIQICRSSTTWSAGIKDTEDSIHKAYQELIAQSKRFIYIENQFFISVHGNNTVKNKISDALYDRIARAVEAKETFKVYILTPLLPGFEGEIGGQTGACIQTIISWNNASMAHGENSLVGRLKKIVENPFDYISFCSVRTYGELSGNLVTELIYIHSKLLIVDDEWAIIGSANINDRSMLGYRDSEIAAILHDTSFINFMNTVTGKEIRTGLFCGSLRKRLFREHLTILDQESQIDFSDPSTDEFFTLWNETAAQNTRIFEEVFRCIPTDKAINFATLMAYQRNEVPPPTFVDGNPPRDMSDPRHEEFNNSAPLLQKSNTGENTLIINNKEPFSMPNKAKEKAEETIKFIDKTPTPVTPNQQEMTFKNGAESTIRQPSAQKIAPDVTVIKNPETKDPSTSQPIPQEPIIVLPLAKADPEKARYLLKTYVKGHLVQTPLHFLSMETNLLPQLLSKEGLAPSTVFT